ncbi:unnamed protein product [Periconia digitata]|uniref:Major facilitator superfamily (MFS) profile domain-containing protein n=1 Tax=Periconia digitata TaxID=1303443 RepID=A0A9W4XQW3_9PLEO|nr:unnamed protein product [Periconia digitata]
MAAKMPKTSKEHIENISDSSFPCDEKNEAFNSIASNEQDTQVPRGYWTSFGFIGSCLAIILLGNSLFIGYSLPVIPPPTSTHMFLLRAFALTRIKKTTQVNILSVINTSIGPDSNIYLISLVNTLIKGVGLLLVGRISDLVGRRYFIIAGQVLGLVGGIIAATAKSVPTVIGANAFIGLAACAQVMYPLLIAEIVPNKYRGVSQCLVTFAVLPSLGFGPIVARCLVEFTVLGWRIVCAASIVLFVFCYHPPDFKQLQRGTTARQQLKRIDYGGFALYSGGLVCLLLALSWGGNQYPWKSAQCIATLILGVLGIIAFVLYGEQGVALSISDHSQTDPSQELYMPLPEPLLPMKLFKVRNYWVAVVVGSIGQMSYYALSVLWPTHITALYTKDNMTVGWMSCTTGTALAMGEVLTGPFLKKGGHAKAQLIASVVGLCVFCGVMSLSDENSQGQAIAVTVCIGLFIGWVELICIVVAGLVIPPEDIGAGSAFFASARAIGGTIATSIYVSIYTNKLSTLTPREVVPAVTSAGLPESSLNALFGAISQATAAALDSVPEMSASIKFTLAAAQKRAAAESLKNVYLSSLSFGFVALLVALFFSDVDQYLTGFVNKTVVDGKRKNEVVHTEKV